MTEKINDKNTNKHEKQKEIILKYDNFVTIQHSS